MGIHIEKKHENYWHSPHELGKSLGIKRYQQIHRYFTLRDRFVQPRQEGESFAWQVEPAASIIRQNCSTKWIPSTHLAIDEAMIPYRGRSIHKVKLKNKPISKGYKV